MQYVRHWALDLQFVFGFRKVNSCQRIKEKHCKSLKLGKISLLVCIIKVVGDTKDLNNLAYI